MLEQHQLPTDKIHVPVKRQKTLDPEKVDALATDMLEHGQKTPIRCRLDTKGKEPKLILVEGYHRLEACRALGEKTITAYLVQAQLR